MMMTRIGKALLTAALPAFLCGLFGCGDAAEYTAEDIRSVSIACGHMDYSHSYSFYLRKAEDGWLLDADFAEDTGQPHEELADCPIAEEEAGELLAMVSEPNVIERLRRGKKRKTRFQALDETTYHTSVLFSDGETADAPIRISQEIEEYFYRLAAKYADAMAETNKT